MSDDTSVSFIEYRVAHGLLFRSEQQQMHPHSRWMEAIIRSSAVPSVPESADFVTPLAGMHNIAFCCHTLPGSLQVTRLVDRNFKAGYRTHAFRFRVHMKALGHPLLGDTLYRRSFSGRFSIPTACISSRSPACMDDSNCGIRLTMHGFHWKLHSLMISVTVFKTSNF